MLDNDNLAKLMRKASKLLDENDVPQKGRLMQILGKNGDTITLEQGVKLTKQERDNLPDWLTKEIINE
jgi:hypothetical protein